MEDTLVYTTKELQEVLRCGKNQAYSLMKSDCFPSIRINSKYIVTKASLDDWLKKNKGKQLII